ncbi:glycosyltransferase family 4 protein [Candidatus Zixiibacteriota bacterium]
MIDKKICLVTLGHQALDDRIFYKEALSLSTAYRQVTVLAAGSGRVHEVEGIRILEIEPGRHQLSTMQRLYSAARKEQADFYHLHEPQLLLVGFMLKALGRAKILYDAHEHFPEMIRDFSRRPRLIAGLFAKAYSLLELSLVYLADGVVVASDHLLKRFARANRRVIAIYNYPRTTLFHGQERVSPVLQERYKTNRVVIYHGQIGRARGLSKLIEATRMVAQRFPDVKLILIGPVFGKTYRKELVERIKAEEAVELVDLLAAVPHRQIGEYIALSEVGLVVLPALPVFEQSLPIKLLEYMACATPVVGSRLPAIEQVISDEECGLLADPADTAEIATAIEHLLEYPEEAKSMGQRGLKAVQERYNWSIMEKRLLALYGELDQVC